MQQKKEHDFNDVTLQAMFEGFEEQLKNFEGSRYALSRVSFMLGAKFFKSFMTSLAVVDGMPHETRMGILNQLLEEADFHIYESIGIRNVGVSVVDKKKNESRKPH